MVLTVACFIVPHSDFFPSLGEYIVFEPSTSSETIRRRCFLTKFSPDGVYENTESYAYDLLSDFSTTNVIVDPDVTEVFLMDRDGKMILASH